jgi:hypothetical protein
LEKNIPIFVRVLIALTFTLCSVGFAQEDRSPEPSVDAGNQSIDWLIFRGNFLYAGYTSEAYQGEFVRSGGFSWNPVYQFSDLLDFRGHLGASVLKTANSTGALFLAPELQFFTDLKALTWITFELGGGVQYWMAPEQPMKTLLSSNLLFNFDKDFLGPLQSVYMGYSLGLSFQSTMQVTLGVQLGF